MSSVVAAPCALLPGLTETTENALCIAVGRILFAWLLPPQDGYLFHRSEGLYARLQVWPGVVQG